MGNFKALPPLAALVSALALTGCGGGGFGGFFSSSPTPEPAAIQQLPPPDLPARIRASEVIGRWGYASFHEAKDRQRTEANARGQCSHPYVIGQGPSGGVMMYLADQSQLVELRLKGSASGKDYIGPAGEPGGSARDQEIVFFDGRVMLLRYVDPEISGRYGTGVYVRCAPSAGGVAQRGSPK